jgi:hypothetical protein
MTSMFPIATVFGVTREITNQVQTAKANRNLCKRLGNEVTTLMPILENVNQQFPNLSAQQQQGVSRALEMLNEDLKAALAFVELQNKRGGSFKKLITARGTNSQFEEIEKNIQNSKTTLMFALLNHIRSDQVERKHAENAQNILKTETTLPHKSEIVKCVENNEYDKAISLAKQLLHSGNNQDTQFAHYTMACIYSKLGKVDEALTNLYSAKQEGFMDYQQMDTETDFDNLRSHPDYVKLRYQMEQDLLKKERWRQLPQAKVDDWVRNFDVYDTDGNGTISLKEFQVLMARTLPEEGQNQDKIQEIFGSLDLDRDGNITLNEYLNYMTDREASKNVGEHKDKEDKSFFDRFKFYKSKSERKDKSAS